MAIITLVAPCPFKGCCCACGIDKIRIDDNCIALHSLEPLDAHSLSEGCLALRLRPRRSAQDLKSSRAIVGVQQPMGDHDFLFKIILLGDSAVGKSNLLSRFTRDEFKNDSVATIGVEFAGKTVQYEGKVIKAQERYRAITQAYYRGAVGALLLFDITSAKTFQNAKGMWYDELKDNGDEDIVILLVGNKKDLGHIREVETDDAKAWADSVGITFVETSAQERDGMQVALAPGEPSGNVTLAFETIIHEIFHTVAKGPARGSEPVVKLKKESKNGGSQGGGCSC